MNNEKELQAQIDELKKRLDDFNSFQNIPFPVDLAWQGRGFLKETFFVAGRGTLNVAGEYRIAIPGATANSIVLANNADVLLIQQYASNNFGDSTTQFDITNPAGDTFRYTWDTTGTNPNINATTLPIGSQLVIFSSNFDTANQNAASRPYFGVTGSGDNYFEISNPTPGVVESNKTIGTGSITGGPLTSNYGIYATGTALEEFSFVVFLFNKLFTDND